jgi:thioredoxin reductase (NADPH)
MGHALAADTTRLQQFMTRNGYPYKLIDTQTNKDAELPLLCLDLKTMEMPVETSGDQNLDRDWSPEEIAIRHHRKPQQQRRCDLVVTLVADFILP